MKLTDESLIVLCALTAIAAQLDRDQLGKDMRRIAAMLVENCPDLAPSAGGVNSMATMFENISAGMAGDLPAFLKATGSLN